MSPQERSPDDDESPDIDLDQEIADALGGASLFDLVAKEERAAAQAKAGGPPLDRAPEGLPSMPEHLVIPGKQAVQVGSSAVGTITGVGEADVFIELGLRQQGVVPRGHFATTPELGSRVKVHVTEWDAAEELYVCALRPEVRMRADALEVGAVAQGIVRKVNAGGLEVQIGIHTAFLPASHLALERVEDLDAYIGRTLPVEVVEVDPAKRRLVVSRRGLLQRERDEVRRSAVGGLSVGTRKKGIVSRIEKFGAFVDLGGIEGLVHISEMSHRRIARPEDVVSIGQEVEIEVVAIEEEGRRLRLSMRSMVEDPFSAFVRAHPEGSLVEGKVARIASYGAFIELAEGLEGLAHVSALAPGGVGTPKEVVKLGQTVRVRVASIDAERKRLGLSLLTDRGDRLTDDIADDATVREFSKLHARQQNEPTLGDILKKALEKGGGRR